MDCNGRYESDTNNSTKRTIVVDKIPTLQDKSLDDPMKGRILVSSGLFVPEKFSRAKLTKVFARLGTIRHKQFHLDPSQLRLAVQGNVEKDDGVPAFDGGHDVGIRSHHCHFSRTAFETILSGVFFGI